MSGSLHCAIQKNLSTTLISTLEAKNPNAPGYLEATMNTKQTARAG
jgi:hypothetical protein